MGRRIKSHYPKGGYSHREHRSKRGRRKPSPDRKKGKIKRIMESIQVKKLRKHERNMLEM